MVKVDPTDRPGRLKGGPKSFAGWLITSLLMLLLGVFLLVAVGTFAGNVLYLGYLALSATVFDAWSVLALVSAVLSLTAIAGAVLAARRRRLVLALALSLLALPTMFVTEGSRCDTEASCRALGWAALPASAFDWSVRVRPVTDPNEARTIASEVLSKADSEDSPYRAKRFADHWLVSTTDRDGSPSGHAIRIDTRTAETRLVACPAAKIRCGMQRPTLSDGRRVFRDDRLGIAATFPASRQVCTSRGEDDEPRGFFALLRAPDIPCDLIDDSRQIGVEIARYRMDGCTVMQAPSMPWRRLSPETARLFRRPPTLGGKPSVACELHMHGHIQISVYAVVTSPANPGSAPGVRYEGYIVTTPGHLAEDVRALETFLERVKLGSAV